MGTRTPLVYVCVLNWNGYEDTKECLISLKAVTYPNFKVLVIDNGSIDSSADKLGQDFPGLEIIRNDSNIGYAGGNNEGIKHALAKGAEYVLVLNNDTVVSPDFLNILVDAALADPGIGILGPKILYFRCKDRVWFAGGRICFALGNTLHTGNRMKDGPHFTGVVDEDYQTGCVMMIKKETLERTGLFDTAYTAYFEDADLCVRARKDGFRVACVRDAVIWHKISSSTGGGLTATKAYLKAKSGARFFGKYASPWSRYTTIPLSVFLYIIFVSAISFTQGGKSVFRAFLRGILNGTRKNSTLL